MSKIEKLESTTRAGVAVVTITLDKTVADTAKEFDDIWLKLSNMQGLPDGASIQFVKEFGDTAALMLTVASPRASPVEMQLRAAKIAEAIVRTRSAAVSGSETQRATLLACFPLALDLRDLRVVGGELAAWAQARGARPRSGSRAGWRPSPSAPRCRRSPS